eukprot:Gregarina_sp_Poly_1__6224@NODE_32_length_19284_cov_132_623615_g29_i0_p9_GENE_NODE_32_length_19284_cov_132_623615_g29_i0NODE_32_length_19284_cov_132_623615_g29_i0_p9_ORF_typecomplete_len170_score16_43CTC1_2/PF15491_6/32CTC1_2/PF15491_6/6_1_NODE_32_length_19284_cov_132_623615_g29_i090039512
MRTPTTMRRLNLDLLSTQIPQAEEDPQCFTIPSPAAEIIPKCCCQPIHMDLEVTNQQISVVPLLITQLLPPSLSRQMFTPQLLQRPLRETYWNQINPLVRFRQRPVIAVNPQTPGHTENPVLLQEESQCVALSGDAGKMCCILLSLPQCTIPIVIPLKRQISAPIMTKT